MPHAPCSRTSAADGYGVTICARRTDALERARAELGDTVAAVLADEAEVVALVRAHSSRFGRLDVLVNAAGIAEPSSSDTIDPTTAERLIAVNLRGPLLLVTREALPPLRAAGAEHGKALVVNLGSVAGKPGQQRNTMYSATKAGLISLTRSLQREVASAGIQATARCPGYAAPAMTTNAEVPAEQMIGPEDIAEAVRFLLRTSPCCLAPEIVLSRRGAIA